MLWVLLPLVAGVICSNLLHIVPWCAWVLFLLSVAVFLVFRYTQLIYAVIFSFALLVASPYGEPSVEPLTHATEFAVRPMSGYNGEVVAYCEGDSSWRESGAELYLWSGGAKLSKDSLVICTGRIMPSARGYNDYSSRLVIDNVEYEISLTEAGYSLSFAQRLQHWAESRLERLGLSDQVQGSTMALALGDREHLDDEVTRSYRLSGTSHLLALSGLHIAIVFMFISLVLHHLALFRRGNIAVDILSVILVWLFASMAGLGVSVVRAATMFTLLRLSWVASARYDSLNSLFGAAVIILLFDSGALYDVGFQLSFVSVLGIMLWTQPIYRLVRGSSSVVNWLSSSVIMGVVATLATAPLISYYFGAFSWLSPLTTLPLLFTLAVIILFAMFWILLPIPFLAPFVREVIATCVTVQNYVVERVALFDAQLIEYSATWIDLFVTYLICFIITIFVYRFMRSRENNYQLIFAKFKE